MSVGIVLTPIVEKPWKTGWWLKNHLEKYESQWEGLSHILWKITTCLKPPTSYIRIWEKLYCNIIYVLYIYIYMYLKKNCEYYIYRYMIQSYYVWVHSYIYLCIYIYYSVQRCVHFQKESISNLLRWVDAYYLNGSNIVHMCISICMPIYLSLVYIHISYT